MNQSNRSTYRQLQEMAEQLTTASLLLESFPKEGMSEDMLLQLDIIKRKYSTLLERIEMFQDQVAGRLYRVTGLDEDQI